MALAGASAPLRHEDGGGEGQSGGRRMRGALTDEDGDKAPDHGRQIGGHPKHHP